MRNFCILCWPILGALFGLVVLIAGVIVLYVAVPVIVHREIVQSVILNDSTTEQFERWETFPVPLIFKVYFFNVTNVEEVQSGEIPNVVEVGPYVYRQYREKHNITRNDNTLSYYEHQIYHFDEELSGSLRETDEITMVHAALNGVLQQVESMTPILLPAVNVAIANIFNQPTSMFITATVSDILFEGTPLCVNPNILAVAVCNQIRAAGSLSLRLAEDNSLLFSFFHHKNNTDAGLFMVNDGSWDTADLARILSWNGAFQLDLWPPENPFSRCNAINGTDSSTFAPFVDSLELHVFNTDICRSATVHYEGMETYEGIDGRRYTNGPDMLSADEYDCFCLENRECFKNGAMDLFPCQGADVVLSLPHFLYADEEYLTGVTGIQPNIDLHQTFALLEPNSGIPLRGAKRVQLNMVLRPVPSIVLTQTLTHSLVPMLWIEEGIDLPEELVDELKDRLISNLELIANMKLTVWIVGSLMLAIFTTVTIVVFFRCVVTNIKV